MDRNGGTLVVKELVCAYAGWISPKFHLEVITATTGWLPKACPST